MKGFWIACFSLMLTLGVPLEAEAKRLGGGFSLGKSYTTQKKVAPAPAPTKQQSTTNQAGNTQTQPVKPGMGGLVGGLLAGGLLGALIFGGAFEGVQFMDILLIGLVLFLLFRFLGKRAQPAYAGAGPVEASHTPEPMVRQSADAAPSSSTDGLNDDTALDIPDWFDADAFVAEAPKHFEQLQHAWDEQNWSEMAEYTSPELLAQLKTNRSVLPEQQKTEVVSCMADLIGFNQNRAETVVSINFHGWIKEQGDDQTTEFSEIWHLSRVAGEEGVSWIIVGIEQP
ncbi:MAG TPA: Tim44-like domain-containing protein [Marinobacterium sp.]|nr:Tim44-like domain-containing protein [Marinobacterium sp.]